MDASFLLWALTSRKMSAGTFWRLRCVVGRHCAYKHNWSRRGRMQNGQSAKAMGGRMDFM
jgi:hypothetical protein